MRRIVALCVVTAAGWGCSRTAGAAGSTPAGTPDVVELAATEARDRMAAGTLTSRSLTQAYLNRIAAIDDAGPRLNAVIEINPTALADADALDAERRGGKVRGPSARHPGAAEGQHRRRRHGQLGRLTRDGEPPADQRRVPRGTVARRRRGDRRQDEPERVGQLQVVAIDLGMELSRRADEEPVRARSESRAGPALAPARPLRQASPRSGSAPKPTAASSVPRRLPALSASNRRWGW